MKTSQSYFCLIACSEAVHSASAKAFETGTTAGKSNTSPVLLKNPPETWSILGSNAPRMVRCAPASADLATKRVAFCTRLQTGARKVWKVERYKSVKIMPGWTATHVSHEPYLSCRARAKRTLAYLESLYRINPSHEARKEEIKEEEEEEI